MNGMEHRPVLIVVAGPNGSGKTTVTSRILKHEWMEDAVYVNLDIVAQERFGDKLSSITPNMPDGYMSFLSSCRKEYIFMLK